MNAGGWMDEFRREKERIRLDCGWESDGHGKREGKGEIVGEEGIERPDETRRVKGIRLDGGVGVGEHRTDGGEDPIGRRGKWGNRNLGRSGRCGRGRKNRSWGGGDGTESGREGDAVGRSRQRKSQIRYFLRENYLEMYGR